MSDSESKTAPSVGGGGPRVRPLQDLREAAADLIQALVHVTHDPPYVDIDSELTERLITEAFQEVVAAQLTDLRGERDHAIADRVRTSAECRRLAWDGCVTTDRLVVERERAENAEAELAALRGAGAALPQQLEQWKTAALFKIRTWEMIQGRHRAGETIQSLADDYGVPHEWVRAVLYPENDLDARYGRPSDRTKTARERAEKAEADLTRLRSRGQALVQQWREIAKDFDSAATKTTGSVTASGWLEKCADQLTALLPDEPT